MAGSKVRPVRAVLPALLARLLCVLARRLALGSWLAQRAAHFCRAEVEVDWCRGYKLFNRRLVRVAIPIDKAAGSCQPLYAAPVPSVEDSTAICT